jgi:ADP-heptose:LPS heptosyltransferase
MEFIKVRPNQDYILTLNGNETRISKDQTYIMHYSWAKNIIGDKQPADLRSFNLKLDATDKRILFMRSMGMGDFLFLSPLIKLIKDKYPTCTINFAGAEHQHSLLRMIPGITDIIPMPIIETDFERHDFHFHVSSLLERDDQKSNVYDLYLNEIGAEDVDETYKRPYVHDKFKQETATENLIGIHPFANNPIRALEINLLNSISDKLINNNYNIIIFSNEEEMNAAKIIIKSPKIIWAIEKHKTMEQTANLMKTCQMIIAVDSVIVHLAQAMNIPTIALYGPFPAESRLKYYKNISIIDTNPDCRCCLHSTDMCPKGDGVGSLCLKIDPDLIINVMKKNQIATKPIYFKTEINSYNLTSDKRL